MEKLHFIILTIICTIYVGRATSWQSLREDLFCCTYCHSQIVVLIWVSRIKLIHSSLPRNCSFCNVKFVFIGVADKLVGLAMGVEPACCFEYRDSGVNCI